MTPATTASSSLLIEVSNQVACLTLNRPERRNALSRQMLSDLEAAQNVCPKCGYHLRIGSAQRFTAIFDNGVYEELPLPDVAPNSCIDGAVLSRGDYDVFQVRPTATQTRGVLPLVDRRRIPAHVLGEPERKPKVMRGRENPSRRTRGLPD